MDKLELIELIKSYTHFYKINWYEAKSYNVDVTPYFETVPEYFANREYVYIPYEIGEQCLPIIGSISQCKGGSHGGNCWGGVASNYVNEDYETPSLDEVISKFLEEHFPDCSFAIYNAIMKEVKLVENYNSEYYGNYSINVKAILDINTMAEILINGIKK